MVIRLAALAQAPECGRGYKPKVGDKVVIACDEAGRPIYIAKEAFADGPLIARDFVNPISGKHKADYKEINDIATQAGFLVTLLGQKQGVAREQMRK